MQCCSGTVHQRYVQGCSAPFLIVVACVILTEWVLRGRSASPRRDLHVTGSATGSFTNSIDTTGWLVPAPPTRHQCCTIPRHPPYHAVRCGPPLADLLLFAVAPQVVAHVDHYRRLQLHLGPGPRCRMPGSILHAPSHVPVRSAGAWYVARVMGVAVTDASLPPWLRTGTGTTMPSTATKTRSLAPSWFHG